MTCRFCGGTTELQTGATHRPEIAVDPEQVHADLRAFEASYAEQLGAGVDAVEAFQGCARSALGAHCDADTITNVSFGLAAGFCRSHGLPLSAVYPQMARLAGAYLRALGELGEARQVDVNLPFLVVGERGPLHLHRQVTVAQLRELAEVAVERHLQPVAPPARSWWARLFS